MPAGAIDATNSTITPQQVNAAGLVGDKVEAQRPTRSAQSTKIDVPKGDMAGVLASASATGRSEGIKKEGHYVVETFKLNIPKEVSIGIGKEVSVGKVAERLKISIPKKVSDAAGIPREVSVGNLTRTQANKLAKFIVNHLPDKKLGLDRTKLTKKLTSLFSKKLSADAASKTTLKNPRWSSILLRTYYGKNVDGVPLGRRTLALIVSIGGVEVERSASSSPAPKDGFAKLLLDKVGGRVAIGHASTLEPGSDDYFVGGEVGPFSYDVNKDKDAERDAQTQGRNVTLGPVYIGLGSNETSNSDLSVGLEVSSLSKYLFKSKKSAAKGKSASLPDQDISAKKKSASLRNQDISAGVGYSIPLIDTTYTADTLPDLVEYMSPAAAEAAEFSVRSAEPPMTNPLAFLYVRNPGFLPLEQRQDLGEMESSNPFLSDEQIEAQKRFRAEYDEQIEAWDNRSTDSVRVVEYGTTVFDDPSKLLGPFADMLPDRYRQQDVPERGN